MLPNTLVSIHEQLLSLLLIPYYIFSISLYLARERSIIRASVPFFQPEFPVRCVEI